VIARPREHLLQLEPLELVLDTGEEPQAFLLAGLVTHLLAELEERLGVLEAAAAGLEREEVLLQRRLFLQQALRLDVVVPEVGQRGVALDQRDAALLAVDVKETP
jgi:hypothetical protein